jgi:hypothetical protein
MKNIEILQFFDILFLYLFKNSLKKINSFFELWAFFQYLIYLSYSATENYLLIKKKYWKILKKNVVFPEFLIFFVKFEKELR